MAKEKSPKEEVKVVIDGVGQDLAPGIFEKKAQETDESNLPEVKAVGVMQVPGSRTFLPYLITIKGGKVVKVDMLEPDTRAIAVETARDMFVEHFMDIELV